MIRLGLSCFPAILSPISMYMSNKETIWYKIYKFKPKICKKYTFFHNLGGVLGGPYFEPRWTKISGQEGLISSHSRHMYYKGKQGNSVARDLPRTGSETNTTIFVIYIYIGYRFPLSLSTIWGNHLPVNVMFKFPTCIYIYDLEKPPPPFNQ